MMFAGKSVWVSASACTRNNSVTQKLLVFRTYARSTNSWRSWCLGGSLRQAALSLR
ncbi:hypothetical protein [Halotia branconii]|uniref:Uncharacterized protein n=1 Tax=Halotia branconii CENA392 TaxID=1539056 RepID=A0AAJ6NXW1_9CYAN|nr:hypothetical protein [Halotia branconii]WGV28595.1 hypothetical protein QI031_14525 [Halotia branconii CENA392]